IGEPIHGVVLPEAALSPSEYNRLSKWVTAKNSFLVAGVGVPSVSGKKQSQNTVRFNLPFMETITQDKHHRWRLDKSQIRQYGLGHRLNPEKIWWEHINLQNRRLNFFSISEWLVMAALICEDLARPDPVGDLVRAIGPNLVIALLMDGP